MLPESELEHESLLDNSSAREEQLHRKGSLIISQTCKPKTFLGDFNLRLRGHFFAKFYQIKNLKGRKRKIITQAAAGIPASGFGFIWEPYFR